MVQMNTFLSIFIKFRINLSHEPDYQSVTVSVSWEICLFSSVITTQSHLRLIASPVISPPDKLCQDVNECHRKCVPAQVLPSFGSWEYLIADMWRSSLPSVFVFV